MKKEQNKWIISLKIIIGLLIISFLGSFFLKWTYGDLPTGNVAKINIDGVISVNAGVHDTSSDNIVELIEKANKNKDIKAILFEINSPGGGAVASYEIAQAIKKTNKTTVSLIREVGASGGYWVASSTDYIIANPFSITGSIGVIGSYLDFSGFINRYNISYERLVAGEFKDMGSPFVRLNDKERKKLLHQLDFIHESFIKEVANNRNKSYEEIKKISTGEIFLGSQALDLGLIDELGGKEEVEKYLKKKLNLTEIDYADYKKEITLIDALQSLMSTLGFNVGEGIGSSIKKEEISLRT